MSIRGSVVSAMLIASGLGALGGQAAAQEPPGMTREQKLEVIDRDLAVAEGLIKSGQKKLIIGLGIDVAASALLYSGSLNAIALYGPAVLTGGVLLIWGGYQWWDGAQQRNALRTQRIQIAVLPLMPEGARKGFGLSVVAHIAF